MQCSVNYCFLVLVIIETLKCVACSPQIFNVNISCLCSILDFAMNSHLNFYCNIFILYIIFRSIPKCWIWQWRFHTLFNRFSFVFFYQFLICHNGIFHIFLKTLFLLKSTSVVSLDFTLSIYTLYK